MEAVRCEAAGGQLRREIEAHHPELRREFADRRLQAGRPPAEQRGERPGKGGKALERRDAGEHDRCRGRALAQGTHHAGHLPRESRGRHAPHGVVDARGQHIQIRGGNVRHDPGQDRRGVGAVEPAGLPPHRPFRPLVKSPGEVAEQGVLLAVHADPRDDRVTNADDRHAARPGAKRAAAPPCRRQSRHGLAHPESLDERDRQEQACRHGGRQHSRRRQGFRKLTGIAADSRSGMDRYD